MKRLLYALFCLGFILTSLVTFAHGNCLYDEDCPSRERCQDGVCIPVVIENKCAKGVKCIGFPTSIQNKDFTVENTIGIPDTVGWIEVQNLGVKFPPHNASSNESRSGGEQHKIYDYAQGTWNDVTFCLRVSKSDNESLKEFMEKVTVGENIEGSITIHFLNPKAQYSVIWWFELQELTLISFSQGLTADVEHPETLQFSFTVSPGYVKIDVSEEEEEKEDSNVYQDNSLILNLRAELDDIPNQMSLMQSFVYSGIEMQKNDTTVPGDQYHTETCHIDNYGTIDMEFIAEPVSKNWINRVKKQYEGNRGAPKPNGGIELTNRSGEVTSSYNIMAWHVERFDFPTLDSKDDSQLIPYIAICKKPCRPCADDDEADEK